MSASPSTARAQPPAWRVGVAFLVVPALASLSLAIVMPAYAGLPSLWERIFRTATMYALFGAYPPTLVIGLPAYLVLRRLVDPGVWMCMLVGAVVAALPWLVLSLGSTPDSASINGRMTVENGVRTPWGWFQIGGLMLFVGVPGAFGGLVFWLIAAAGWSPSNPVRPDAPPH